jgi:hypothetical protein
LDPKAAEATGNDTGIDSSGPSASAALSKQEINTTHEELICHAKSKYNIDLLPDDIHIIEHSGVYDDVGDYCMTQLIVETYSPGKIDGNEHGQVDLVNKDQGSVGDSLHTTQGLLLPITAEEYSTIISNNDRPYSSPKTATSVNQRLLTTTNAAATAAHYSEEISDESSNSTSSLDKESKPDSDTTYTDISSDEEEDDDQVYRDGAPLTRQEARSRQPPPLPNHSRRHGSSFTYDTSATARDRDAAAQGRFENCVGYTDNSGEEVLYDFITSPPSPAPPPPPLVDNECRGPQAPGPAPAPAPWWIGERLNDSLQLLTRWVLWRTRSVFL